MTASGDETYESGSIKLASGDERYIPDPRVPSSSQQNSRGSQSEQSAPQQTAQVQNLPQIDVNQPTQSAQPAPSAHVVQDTQTSQVSQPATTYVSSPAQTTTQAPAPASAPAAIQQYTAPVQEYVAAPAPAPAPVTTYVTAAPAPTPVTVSVSPAYTGAIANPAYTGAIATTGYTGPIVASPGYTGAIVDPGYTGAIGMTGAVPVQTVDPYPSRYTAPTRYVTESFQPVQQPAQQSVQYVPVPQYVQIVPPAAEEKHKRGRAILIFLLILLLIGGALYGAWAAGLIKIGEGEKQEPAMEQVKGDDKATKISDKDAQQYVNEKVAESEINVNFTPQATFNSDGITSQSFKIRNIENNHDAIEFEIKDENGEVIYSSSPIERGYEMNSITLNKALSRGEHKCTLSVGYISGGNVSSTFPLTIKVL